MNTKELCFLLAKADGTSGAETSACKEAGEILSQYMTVETDTLGSLVGTIGNGKTKILLDAHIDRIGLVVRGIDEKGFLLIEKVGGADPRVLVGSEVVVMGKERLTGVVCSTPPHLMTKEMKEAGVEIKKMAVDIGMTKELAEEYVSIGDRIIPLANQYELLNTRICSSAFDNRCGVAAVIMAVEAVKDKLKNCTVCVQLSSQEETGGSGAKASAFSLDPDYAITVDVGFGTDPYCDRTQTVDLGKGPSIGISPVLDRELTKQLVSLAKENNIPFQHDVMGGRTGTNADNINTTRGGVKTGLISIPLRNMHTAVEVIDTVDIENTAKLIEKFILAKEAELQ